MEKINYFILWQDKNGENVKKAATGYKLDNMAAVRNAGAAWVVDYIPAGVKVATAATRKDAIAIYETEARARIENADPEKMKKIAELFAAAPFEKAATDTAEFKTDYKYRADRLRETAKKAGLEIVKDEILKLKTPVYVLEIAGDADALQELRTTVENEQPGDKARTLADKIARVPGLEVELKGAKTARPIIWVTGTTTYKNRPFLKSQGGRWSSAKNAWYIAV